MRLPLIVSGVTSKVCNCAIVRIPQGNWKIVIENWIDCSLSISPVPYVGQDIEFHLPEPTSIQLCITKPGTETNLNVYLEKVGEAKKAAQQVNGGGAEILSGSVVAVSLE
jgi:hypothetical protein